MAVKLNGAGKSKAQSLIKAGKVDQESPWSFTATDEDKILGDPPDWKAYGEWFMGQDTAADAETKAAWKYPFGKDGQVFRSAIRAIRTRASQQNETEIADAAKACLDMMDEMMTQDVLRHAPPAPAPPVGASAREWYRILAEGEAPEVADVSLFDEIGEGFFGGGITAKAFAEDLAKLPESVKTLRVHVNSPGGNVFEALAIANVLRQHRARVEMSIEGVAASAATIVTNGGGDSIKIADNALVMVHNPFGVTVGTAKDMRATADALDRAQSAIIASYQRVSPLSRDALAGMMDAVTWMDAEEALANGFATEIVQGLQAAASIDPKAMGRIAGQVPERFAARVKALVKAEGAPAKPVASPAPAPDAPPTPAPTTSVDAAAGAEDILALCAAVGLDVDFARALLAEHPTAAAAAARVEDEKHRRKAETDRQDGIRALCAKFKVPDLAAELIGGGMSFDAARGLVAKVTALVDRVEIDSGLTPDARTGKKAAIDTQAIFAARATTPTRH